MSLPFNQTIEMVAKIFEFSEADHNAFMSDVQTISNKIKLKYLEGDCIFKNMFQDLHKTAHYRKGEFFDMPDDFCSHLMMELPFDDIDYCFTKPHFVTLKTNHVYPLVYEGHIDAFIFAFKFRNSLEKVISQLPPILCQGGRIYLVKLCADLFDGIRDWPRIIAKEQFCLDGHPGEITFQFLPILKFPLDSKYSSHLTKSYGAYWTCASPFPEPITHRNRFHQFVPGIQLMKAKDMMKARKAIILVHSFMIHGNIAKISPLVETFIYKNIYFVLLEEKNINYMRDINLAKTFMDMLWSVKSHVGFYEFPGKIQVYAKLNNIYHTMIAMKIINMVPFNEVLKLFGLI